MALVPLANISLSSDDTDRVLRTLFSTYISGTGPNIDEFQEQLQSIHGRDYALAVANGTLALELALRALNIGPGSTVLVPAFTFAAPANAVLAVGARPIMVDVNPDDGCMDPDDAMSKMRNDVAAVIVVNILGQIPDYEPFRDLRVPIIEDAAQSHGSRRNGRYAGSFGDISTFSFHGNKTISTGEGGAVLTDDQFLFDRMKLIMNHGMSTSRRYHHDIPGSNYRMSNLTAAIGVGQLERWAQLTSEKRRIGELYDQLFSETFSDFWIRSDKIVAVMPWPAFSDDCDVCPWLYPIVTPFRDDLVSLLNIADIDARAVWPSLTQQGAFWDGSSCQVAEKMSKDMLLIPTWVGIPESTQRLVVNKIAESVTHIQDRLGSKFW